MRRNSSLAFLLLLICGVIAASITMVNGFSPINDKRVGEQTGAIAVKPPPDNGHANLQLKTFSFATPTPQPTSSQCAVDNEKKGNCECISAADPFERDGVICENKNSDGTCPDGNPLFNSSDCSKWAPYLQNSWGCDSKSCIYVKDHDPTYDKYAGDNNPNCPNGHAICWGKPVIYLYPTHDMLVDVTLSIPGFVTKSDPEYDNGWFGVLAHLGGSLDYHGKSYHELYYEDQVSVKPEIQSGTFLEKTNLQQSLSEITTKLGLLPNEQQEFLAYWVPKLSIVQSKYIFVSILNPLEKEKVDHVTITPKPQTSIAYLFYFKGVNQPYPINQLMLPAAPPQRTGFTAVEWGGTIDD